MPGKLKVRIVSGRGLPVMDRASDLTDAFVEVRFGNEVLKTEVCRKNLNPQWNSEWFKFEVEDEVLQDEPLELRVLDHDTYSAHDAIGKVYIDLNPLLNKENRAVNIINGWFPIYDTMHGIRGELFICVKVDLFEDVNRFRQSSCGIQFFCTPEVPNGFKLQSICGFVEELVVNDDPEYKWIDKIRTPRASNEARQRLFSKLAGELQRKIGLKVFDMRGNAVIGYNQCFDLEGESGIVVRGIGTAVSLSRLSILSGSPLGVSPMKESPGPEDTPVPPASPPMQHMRISTSPVKMTGPLVQGLPSDLDLSTPPKGGSLTESSGSGSGGKVTRLCSQQNIELMEYPFFTMKSFPSGFIASLCGVVSARSVKLLDEIHNPDEPETRDAWWAEIRTEIRSHMKAMGCHVVLGYTEQTSICEETIMLSAVGTAAIVNFNTEQQALTRAACQPLQPSFGLAVQQEREKDKKLFVDVNLANEMSQNRLSSNMESFDDLNFQCSVCHIPYKPNAVPFKINLTLCGLCRRKQVPDVLFTTIEPPQELQVTGRSCLIQARIVRPRQKTKGDGNAKEISDSLPFMEYEMHNQLYNKLKIHCMNGLFGLKIKISISETMLIGVATATGVYISALPTPSIPKLSSQMVTEKDNKNMHELQKKIDDAVRKNRDIYDLQVLDISTQPSPLPCTSPLDENDEEVSDLELSTGNKDTFVLEVDDANDETVNIVLQDLPLPDGFEVCNTQNLPGGNQTFLYNLQLFNQVWKGEIDVSACKNREISELFEKLLRRICFKLRKMTPCALCSLDFGIETPDEYELQISISGICVGLGENLGDSSCFLELPPTNKTVLRTVSSGSSLPSSGSEREDMIFDMDSVTDSAVKHQKSESSLKKTPQQGQVTKQRSGVELTPLSFVTGGKIEKYLGSYNFFFIRECTSLRESGGENGFIQTFIAEVMAILRSHVAALGGNALVAYKMNECILETNLHKNQSQCLINVCGDAVHVNYDGESSLQTSSTEIVRKHSDSPGLVFGV